MTRMVKCPTCQKETLWQGNPYRPFCSERCRMIDLGAWASESYRISGEKTEGQADEQPERQTGGQSKSQANIPSRRTDR
jgi:endogenous inhibitor of DNA gyrase (YacG/DUF329 family)